MILGRRVPENILKKNPFSWIPGREFLENFKNIDDTLSWRFDKKIFIIFYREVLEEN